MAQYTGPQRRAQPTTSEPDESNVAMHIRVAAWHIHMAICELTGATQSWGDASNAYRTDLKDKIRKLIQGDGHE